MNFNEITKQWDNMFENYRAIRYIDKNRKYRLTSYIADPELLILIEKFFKNETKNENKKVQLKTKIGTARVLAVLTSTDLMIDKYKKSYVISQNYVKNIAKSLDVKESAFRYVMKFLTNYKVSEHKIIEKEASTYIIPRYNQKFGSQNKFIEHLAKFFTKEEGEKSVYTIENYKGFYNSQNKKIRKSKLDLTNSNISKSTKKSSTEVKDTYKFKFDKENVEDLFSKYDKYKEMVKTKDKFITRNNKKSILSLINYVENIILKNNKDFFETNYLNITEKVSIKNGRVFSMITNMPKKIRNILFRGYTSIDINNAAPNFILNVLFNKVEVKEIKKVSEQKEFLKSKFPAFYLYTKDRESYFKNLYKKSKANISFDDFQKYFKRLCLSIIFGANFEYEKTLLLSNKEKNNAFSKIYEEFNEEFKFNKNSKSSFQNILRNISEYISYFEKDIKNIADFLKTSRKGLSNLFMNEETKIINYIIRTLKNDKEYNKERIVRIHDEILVKDISFENILKIEKMFNEKKLKVKVFYKSYEDKRINTKKILNELNDLDTEDKIKIQKTKELYLLSCLPTSYNKKDIIKAILSRIETEIEIKSSKKSNKDSNKDFNKDFNKSNKDFNKDFKRTESSNNKNQKFTKRTESLKWEPNGLPPRERRKTIHCCLVLKMDFFNT